MRIGRLQAVSAAAGIALGLVVAVGLVLSGSLDHRATARPAPEATEEFIAAFQRSLSGTYAVEADFTRVLTNGRTLRSGAFVAQRPPDHIRRQFGGITGTVNGSEIMCSTEQGSPFHCGANPATAPDPAQSLAEALVNLRSYFESPPLYRAVASGKGCFDLTQVRAYPLAPYGSQARICFDRDTGAIRYLQERLEGAVDTFEATRVRAVVSDADFDLSQDHGFDLHADGEPDDTTAQAGAPDLPAAAIPRDLPQQLATTTTSSSTPTPTPAPGSSTTVSSPTGTSPGG